MKTKRSVEVTTDTLNAISEDLLLLAEKYGFDQDEFFVIVQFHTAAVCRMNDLEMTNAIYMDENDEEVEAPFAKPDDGTSGDH